MLYYLFEYLDKQLQISGTGVFKYISFRASMAVIFSLLIAFFFGRKLIDMLRKFQAKEDVRNLGLDGEQQKQGTPTMGGIMIILAIIVPTLLFARIDNIYIILLLASTVWLGFIGFLDDYTKVFKKKSNWLVGNRGIKGRYKVLGQIILGLVVGLILIVDESVIVREYIDEFSYREFKSTVTTLPFFKNNEFEYGNILWFLGQNASVWAGKGLYILITIIVITAVSNGANITDGLDGLAAGTSAIIGITLGVLAYVSGNFVFAEYLNIMYIPHLGEVVIFCAAFAGAAIGFLWYNSYPAQIFMGDTGSLSLGGIIAVLALSIRKELLIPILCGVFLIENLSVIIQVAYFKYTKRKYGEGKRIFLMSPLHHHYQKKGIHEAKIVARFWIVGIILAILTLATLKLR